MASETVRQEIWQNMLDVDRQTRYYHTLTERYQRKRNALNIVLFLAAAGGVSALVHILPASLAPLLHGVVIVCVVFEFVRDYATKTAVLYTIRRDCQDLATEWQSLWAQQNQLDEPTLIQRDTQLSHRLDTVTGRVDFIGIQEDVTLNETSTDTAYKTMGERYGATP